MKWQRTAVLGLAIVAIAAGCEGQGTWTVAEPTGDAQLPDLAPMPPVDLHVFHREDNGEVELRFTSTLVNVGDGDFVLRGTRDDPADPLAWTVEQELRYSEEGAELRPTDAEMVWGGDGHDHWHVKRVAEYRLVPLDDAGDERLEEAVIDTKIGFCFFDSNRMEMELGPDKAAFSHEQCGDEEETRFRVGLTPGWGDVYSFALPGQSFDITDAPDGRYRLWAEADSQGWFDEADTANNVTWADIDLRTMTNGLRAFFIADVGPDPTTPEAAEFSSLGRAVGAVTHH